MVISAALALALLGSVPALAAAGSGVRGELLDATCAEGCTTPCPPPPTCRGAHACTLSSLRPGIVCPLQSSRSRICLSTVRDCGPVVFPPYTGEGAEVIVRRAGSEQVLTRKVPREGHFSLRLPPGRYVLRAHVALPCWEGERASVEVEAGHFAPLALEVFDPCAVHPDQG
jgi:hypothetical protein